MTNLLEKKIELLPPEHRWLVTSEGAFSYLASDYGLKEAFLWPINADGQGTPQQVREVIDLVKKHQIPAILAKAQYQRNLHSKSRVKQELGMEVSYMWIL